MSNITEQFSFWLLPELGGLSVHLISHSCSSFCFPCTPAGPDGTFMLSIQWPQGYLLLLAWACQVSRQKQTWSPLTPQWPPWREVQWVRTCHQLRARRCPLFPPFPIHTLSWHCHIQAWQWASGSTEPQHCSGTTWLSQPRGPQPHPCVLPCSGIGQAWDKLSQW